MAFGHVVGRRSLAVPSADEIVVPLFNTVPFRITLDKTYVTNVNVAKRIQEDSGELKTYQHAALGKVQQGWRSRTWDADAQLFNTLFAFQIYANIDPSVERLWIPYNTDEAAIFAEYSTNFEVEQYSEKIVIRAISRKGLTTQEQLHTWLVSFKEIFRDVLKRPNRSVVACPASLQSLSLITANANNDAPPQTHDTIEPGSDVESIRTASSEISRIPTKHISGNASIFILGLDSIAAIQVAAICRQQGLALSVADIL